ncbi:unnamed protein product, partial [Brenthis ino]
MDNAIEDLDGDMTPEELAQFSQRLNLVFPGTKWCGPGDTADNYDDLGTAKETDMCCRDHDYCENIPSGETKYNLTNSAYYTRLNCKCDEKFRKCLRSANSETSRTVGITYFNIIGTQCYRKDYPIIQCKRKGGWLNQKCLEYSYDTRSEKVYQWFDVPNF